MIIRSNRSSLPQQNKVDKRFSAQRRDEEVANKATAIGSTPPLKRSFNPHVLSRKHPPQQSPSNSMYIDWSLMGTHLKTMTL